MDIYDLWPYVVVVASGVLLPLLLTGDHPLGAVRLINKIKDRFNLSGNGARALTIVVSILLAVVIGVTNGTLTPETLTPESFLTLCVMVLGASQYWYNRL